MRKFGLIGFPLDHSFSPGYFREKFQTEKITDAEYNLYPLKTISELPFLLRNEPDLAGLNVTIPYKRAVKEFLHSIDGAAEEIGAVNCISINKKGHLKGYNTDAWGFEKSLAPLLKPYHKKALILGGGGSSLAVYYVLKKLNVSCLIVSRNPGPDVITYEELGEEIVSSHKIIINTTPLGMFPETGKCPAINYEVLGKEHLLFDLIYNPIKTLFLMKGEERGATTKNGLEMLELQADRSWEIWNNNETT